MKTRKMLLSLLSLLIAGSLFAQGPKEKPERTPEEKAKKQTEWMTKKLQLTEKQVAEVEKINKKFASEADKQRKEQMEKREKQRTQHEAEIKKVLTPEQIAKYDELKKQRDLKQNQRKERMENCRKKCQEEQAQPSN